MISDFLIQNERIAVLCGGRSSERAISLRSAQCIYQALTQLKATVELIDTANNPIHLIQKFKPTIAFIALHGGEGENGTIQSLLNLLNIPYTGSSAQASALAIDKYRTKLVWRGHHLPTPDFCIVSPGKTIPADHPFPCVVKANTQGSTIGIFLVKQRDQLKEAIQKASIYDHEVLIEKWIEGPEFSVSIVGNQVLPPVKIVPASGFYNYQAKYETKTTRYLIPCELNTAEENKLKALAYDAFQIIGCSGWGRVDVLQDAQGQFWPIEINTVPGFTEHSLVPKSAAAMGMDVPTLIQTILATAQQKTPHKPGYLFSKQRTPTNDHA